MGRTCVFGMVEPTRQFMKMYKMFFWRCRSKDSNLSFPSFEEPSAYHWATAMLLTIAYHLVFLYLLGKYARALHRDVQLSKWLHGQPRQLAIRRFM